MDETELRKLTDQALASAINHLYTCRVGRAMELFAQVLRIDPDNAMASLLLDGVKALPFSDAHRELVVEFMGKWWNGEPLAGKTIEVFCDQGMGDIVNLMRYLKVLKDGGECRIVLNCYAYHAEMRRLIATQPYIDAFVSAHERCDYFTDLMTVPAMLNGLFYDPDSAHFSEVIETPIPEQPALAPLGTPLRPDGFKVGLAWHSNMDNPIGKKKSIPLSAFAVLEDGQTDMFSLIPNGERVNFLVQLPIADVLDAARIIEGCDAVVAVDTLALHVAGLMRKPTLALLPHAADARWGGGDRTVWYPSVELFRQSPDLDWEPVIRRVKDRLVSLRAVS
jgi:hypothetical protein